jgi:NADH-quinone oxidoreductase subunit E/NADP-reducing hydrogenase subunit HndA
MDKQCLCDLTKEHEAGIVEICKKYADVPGSLITILNDVQEYFGFLPIQVQEIIARETGISLTEIYGVATFYSRFSLTPTGKHKVSVCLGTACYVKGAQSLIDGFERQLNLKVGETSEDGEYTLEATRCIGACGLAPVLTIDGEVHGNVSSDDISKLLAGIKNKEENA